MYRSIEGQTIGCRGGTNVRIFGVLPIVVSGLHLVILTQTDSATNSGGKHHRG
jgi:hypothetical protein